MSFIREAGTFSAFDNALLLISSGLRAHVTTGARAHVLRESAVTFGE